MEYQVPQFIEVEDKIVGPLTLRQFIYLAGGAGLSIGAYLYLPFLLAILIIIPFGGLALALAFYKVNGKSFPEVLESAFAFYTHSRLFLWKRELKENKPERETVPALSLREANQTRATPRLTGGKLHDLAWSLDIKKRDQAPQ